jgi:hypothetical protein
MIEQYGEINYFDGKKMHKREMTDDELKCMMGHIQLNRGFSLPDQLLNDFFMDGPSRPTMKNCIHFNKNDFKKIVEPLKPKNIRKPFPKLKSHKQRRKVKKSIEKEEIKENKKINQKIDKKTRKNLKKK